MSAQLEAVPPSLEWQGALLTMSGDALLALWRQHATEADREKAIADRLWAEVECRTALEKAGIPLGI